MELRRIKIKSILKFVIPIVIGAVAGYAYYYYIGCDRGCAITGNPWTSALYGVAVGAVFSNWHIFKKTKDVNKQER